MAGAASEFPHGAVWAAAVRARDGHGGIKRSIARPVLLQTICIAVGSTAAYSA